MEKKVILITGASSGIGKITALQLIGEGHIVYGASRRLSKMVDLVSKGGFSIEMDITNEQQLLSGVSRVITEQGRIDVLINNAGYGTFGSVEETTIEEARRQFEVNLFGLARLTQLVIPHMRENRSGKIINMSSMGGKMYTPMGAWYHATKYALEGWSDCLRLELNQFGIKVVIIEPGVIGTEFGEVMIGPLMGRSGDGPYGNIAHTLAKESGKYYNRKKYSSSPAIVANAISKAIRSNRPKTRYVAGYLARPMIWMRKYLGDRIFDWAMLSQINNQTAKS